MENKNKILKEDYLYALDALENNSLPKSERDMMQEIVTRYLNENNQPNFEIQKSTDLMNKEISKFPYLIDKLIPKKAITSITADSGKGKSLIALEIANAVSQGASLFQEFTTEKSKVLYIDQEMDQDLVIGRAKAILSDNSNIDFMIEQFWQIDNTEHYNWIKDIINTNDYKLVIFDTLTTVHSKEENSSKEMREINQLMLKLIKETDTTIIYLHHHRKQGRGDKYDQASSRGSTEIIAKVASHLLITSNKKTDENNLNYLEMTISQEKARRPDGITNIGVNIKYDHTTNTTTFEYSGEVDQLAESVQNAERFVIDVLSNDPSEFTIKLLVSKARVKDSSIKEFAIRKACKYLHENNIIQSKKGEGKNWNTSFYFIPIVND